jgi:hypothetical protein
MKLNLEQRTFSYLFLLNDEQKYWDIACITFSPLLGKILLSDVFENEPFVEEM